MKRKLSPADIAMARRLYRDGTRIHVLMKMFGRGYETIRRVVDPEYREIRNTYERMRRAEADGVENPTYRAHIPLPVEADRDRRINAPRTITALVCGDPPPGYSALDRRNRGEA